MKPIGAPLCASSSFGGSASLNRAVSLMAAPVTRWASDSTGPDLCRDPQLQVAACGRGFAAVFQVAGFAIDIRDPRPWKSAAYMTSRNIRRSSGGGVGLPLFGFGMGESIEPPGDADGRRRDVARLQHSLDAVPGHVGLQQFFDLVGVDTESAR